ncbi:hypothetical protein NY78_0635 [Desulfovibrio sp. TomC]|nr:hypothetical protein NY78_0635 [Desulfovibrio sp. TomC]
MGCAHVRVSLELFASFRPRLVEQRAQMCNGQFRQGGADEARTNGTGRSGCSA